MLSSQTEKQEDKELGVAPIPEEVKKAREKGEHVPFIRPDQYLSNWHWLLPDNRRIFVDV